MRLIASEPLIVSNYHLHALNRLTTWQAAPHGSHSHNVSASVLTQVMSPPYSRRCSSPESVPYQIPVRDRSGLRYFHDPAPASEERFPSSVGSDVERTWRRGDSQGQILALGFKRKSLKTLNFFPRRSREEAVRSAAPHGSHSHNVSASVLTQVLMA